MAPNPVQNFAGGYASKDIQPASASISENNIESPKAVKMAEKLDQNESFDQGPSEVKISKKYKLQDGDEVLDYRYDENGKRKKRIRRIKK